MLDDSESKNEETDQVEKLSPRITSNGVINHVQVETAVKFLRNPKVAGTPIERQIAFLKQKGLTEDEISLARNTVGIPNIAEGNQDNGAIFTKENGESLNPVTGPQFVAQVTHPSEMRSSRWRDWAGTALIGAGLIYGVSYFIKSQIVPLVFGREGAESKETSEELKATLQELREGFGGVAVELRNTFREIQHHLEEQRQAVSTLSTEMHELKGRVHSISSDTTSLTEMRNELSSLKGLVLGRRQFPPSPFSIAGGGASIPAWQKIASSPSKSTNDLSCMPSSSSSEAVPSMDRKTEIEKIGNVELSFPNVEEDFVRVTASNGERGRHLVEDNTMYNDALLNSAQETDKVDDSLIDVVKDLSELKNEKTGQGLEGASEVSSSSDTSIPVKISSSEESMDGCILLKGSSSDTIAQMYVDLDVTSTN